MKLSDSTKMVLKNFTSINPSILIRPGNKITTITPQGHIMAATVVEENFDHTFAIYDLNQFLSSLSIFPDNPELEFHDEYLVMKSQAHSLNYFFTDPENVTQVPDKQVVLNDPEINFELKQKDIDYIRKSSGILQLGTFAVVGKNGKMSLQVFDSKNSNGNYYKIDLGETKHTYNMMISIENLKLMDGTYDVNISSKGVSRFINKANQLTYWIATDIDSKFG